MVRTRAELLDLSGGDPWVRWVLPEPLTAEVWVHDGVAMVQRRGHRPGFWVAPLEPVPGEQVRRALLQLRDGGHLDRLGGRSVSVVQEHAGVAHEVLDLGGGADWDWMSTTSAPPTTQGEAHLIPLDDTRDAEELRAFAHAHNPRVWTEIGTGRVQRWLGLRGPDGALTAVGGAEAEETGVPHLAGIVTATHLRGRGLGTVVSAGLTRWAVAEHGACTLGMFSDNDAARSVYTRLGYRTARAWHSRELLRTTR